MFTLAELSDLTQRYRSELDHPVESVRIGTRLVDTDSQPLIMGAINLSRDSTYRESIAPSTEAAVRKARVMIAQGADFVDIGAESSNARAELVAAPAQRDRLEPVVLALSSQGIATSIEAYDVDVAECGLKAGASIINYTGAAADEAMFDLAARFGATLIVCFQPGANARDIGKVQVDGDPIPVLIDHFGTRIERARSHGVSDMIIDPGLGFYYANLVDPAVRVAYQTKVMLHSFRLRELGLPICQALPHAFDLFEDEFRTAEAQFAILARLAKAGVLRVHEVARVAATLRLLALEVPTW